MRERSSVIARYISYFKRKFVVYNSVLFLRNKANNGRNVEEVNSAIKPHKTRNHNVEKESEQLESHAWVGGIQ